MILKISFIVTANVAKTVPILLKPWNNCAIHCHPQRSIPLPQGTNALVLFQGEPNHGSLKHNMKLRLHQPQCFHPWSEGQKRLGSNFIPF